jgi:predicted RNA polymerase sigma factor
MAHGPSAGLALLDEVDERLDGHYRVDAVRAHLLEMAGDADAALMHYRAAASRTTSVPEQHYLAKQVSRITSSQ